jgi:hypothetical protein
MGNRRLILLWLVAAAAGWGCAAGPGICDGAAIDVRPALVDPVRETSMVCTGHLVDVCTQPTVRLDDSRCEEPQVEVAPRDGNPWIGVTLTVEAGEVVGAVASTTAGDESYPVASGWLQLYEGSLDDPDVLSGELEIRTLDGASVSGRFSALTNP